MPNRKREWKDKIRTAKGFVLSLLLHLSILLLFWVSSDQLLSPPPPKGKKITLDLSKIVTPPPTPKPQMKPVPPPQPVIPPQPKPKPKPKPKKIVKEKPQPEKKVVQKKKVMTAKKAMEDNNITKSIEKPKKKIVKKEKKKEKKIVKKKVVKKTPPKKLKNEKPKKKVAQKKPRPKQYNSSLANSLMGSKSAQSMQTTRPSRSSAASPAAKRMIKQLYGSEFNGYSAEQKKFIENNLVIIHRLTQMTLNRNGYPEIAARTGQQGTNIVSFYLHPNGNITSLRLDKHMGYEALDRNTLQVIRIAYKDYPLPRKKTKIKFFVQYSIDGY